MKAFQKMTLLLLALTMVLTLFAACGKDKTNAEQTVDSTVDTSDPNDPKLEAIDGGGENFHFQHRRRHRTGGQLAALVAVDGALHLPDGLAGAAGGNLPTVRQHQ